MIKPAEHDSLSPAAAADSEAAFDEPWQAEVLAVAYALVEQGAISRIQWSDELGASLQRASAAGAPDTLATYYTAALDALETLLASAGQITPQALAERTESWRHAYLATPHGEPVLLSAAADGS